ncbi:MAG: hypothetical protein APF84_16445 [Gracilibacter sp. BRH_c7a]|nr:MAG: hypothetical protein APF84_16445 [Gracilibacter sp. BRH_c7a]
MQTTAEVAANKGGSILRIIHVDTYGYSNPVFNVLAPMFIKFILIWLLQEISYHMLKEVSSKKRNFIQALTIKGIFLTMK